MMSLTLYFHPLASYCQKVLIALYESGTSFKTELVDFGNPESAASFRALGPVGKMPVLRDTARDRTVPHQRRMSEADWAREGRHTESGRYTAEDWLRIYAAHLEGHARQIEGNVRAWKARPSSR